ncbi:hypothetical protein [Euzebya sp.]|uniref:hypothetical protein n=1 Tax=Euzebya sp. TaxID=1971409 RepID=UPI003515D86D
MQEDRLGLAGPQEDDVVDGQVEVRSAGQHLLVRGPPHEPVGRQARRVHRVGQPVAPVDEHARRVARRQAPQQRRRGLEAGDARRLHLQHRRRDERRGDVVGEAVEVEVRRLDQRRPDADLVRDRRVGVAAVREAAAGVPRQVADDLTAEHL